MLGSPPFLGLAACANRQPRSLEPTYCHDSYPQRLTILSIAWYNFEYAMHLSPNQAKLPSARLWMPQPGTQLVELSVHALSLTVYARAE